MALFVLITLGASLGWAASILARTDAPSAILRQIALGILISLLVGLLANAGSLLGGLSLRTIGVASVAAATALVFHHVFVNRRSNLEA